MQDIAEYAHAGAKVVTLKDEADTGPGVAQFFSRQTCNGPVLDPNISIAGFDQAHRATQCGAFAGSVGADDCDGFTGLHREVDTAKYFVGAIPTLVSLSQPADRQGRSGIGTLSAGVESRRGECFRRISPTRIPYVRADDPNTISCR